MGVQVDKAVGVRALQGELVLRAADRVVERQILHRLHVQRDARDVRRFAAAGAGSHRSTFVLRSARGFRLIRKRPLFSVTLLPSTPMNDERLTHVRILENGGGERLLAIGHGGIGDRLGRLRDALNQARCPGPGKKPFGMST